MPVCRSLIEFAELLDFGILFAPEKQKEKPLFILLDKLLHKRLLLMRLFVFFSLLSIISETTQNFKQIKIRRKMCKNFSLEALKKKCFKIFFKQKYFSVTLNLE